MFRSLHSCARSLARQRIIAAPRAAEHFARRTLATSAVRHSETPANSNYAADIEAHEPEVDGEISVESYVRSIREQWGDNLPEDLLTPNEYAVYERYYGPPVRMLKANETVEEEEEVDFFSDEPVSTDGTVTLEGADGVVIELPEMEPEFTPEELQELAEGKIRARSEKEAAMYAKIGEDIAKAFALAEEGGEGEEMGLQREDEFDDELEDDYISRTHPLTELGRFGTFPGTVIPPESITGPTAALLSDVSNRHLDEAAYKILGGEALLNSPIMTGVRSKTYNAMPLDTSHSMSGMEANVHVATVLPGYYAQTLSTLTELRRRLGGDWILGQEGEGGKEPGVKRVLDVGTGGAGILAWRAIVEAEQALREEKASVLDGVEPTPVEEKPIDEVIAPAGRNAVVVVGSDTLRFRMSKYLENTTFIPRIPDLINSSGIPSFKEVEAEEKQPRKYYDLIIATNTILPIFEGHKRKNHVQNLWHLLNPSGGVLLLVEKGTPLGFEAIASARSSLLTHNISHPDSSTVPLTETDEISNPRTPKETASIIAPCTNHAPCPMFTTGPGRSLRRDYCSFTQRYERPGYMQRILKAKHRNHEDLQYSYVAVRRGIDVTKQETPIDPKPEEFDTEVTPQKSPYSMEQLRAHAYTLPRAVFPPIKRRGHVTLDVCTSMGNIERWTVPKSFSKTAYRDARKSKWGDLWALGAKTQVPRNLSLGDKSKGVMKKKVTHVVDFAESEVKEVEKIVDKPGGKKKNPGKRERERRQARREAQKAYGKERDAVKKVAERLQKQG